MLRDFTAGQVALAVLGISLLIAWHELGHYLVARLTGMKVLRYSLGFGPKLVGFRRGHIDYQIAVMPFGGFVQIFGMTPLEPGAREHPRSFINQPRWARVAVLLAGPGFNYLLAFGLFLAFHLAWPGAFGQIDAVTPESPAAEAGLLAGDRVVQVGGRNLRYAGQLEERLLAGGEVRVRVFRGEEDLEDLELTLDATGASSLAGLGLAVSPREIDVGLGAAVADSLRDCWRQSAATIEGIARLVAGDPEVSASGPIGVVSALQEHVRRSFPDFVWLLAVLSVTLGLFNLLPVPALDGIKILVLVVEGVIRRDVSPVLQVWVNALGLLALLVLMVALSVGDIAELMAG